MLPSLLRHWLRSFKTSAGYHRRKPRSPFLEALESRLVPSTINVTTTADEVNPNDGVISLREAINQANADPNGDVINLPPGTYKITIANAGGQPESNNVSGSFDIQKSISIVGTGGGPGGPSIIDGNGSVINDRVFDVLFNATVQFVGVTIQNGSTTSDGGGIRAETGAIIKLTNSLVRNNTAAGGGGGIAAFPTEGPTGGTVSLDNSTVTGNTANGIRGGGGILTNHGAVSVTNGSIVSSNQAASTASNSQGGGGINSEGAAVTITNSSILTNTTAAREGGGGIQTEGGAVSITGTVDQFSNVNNNTASASGMIGGQPTEGGGGIETQGGTVTVSNSNINNNISAGMESGGAIATEGGKVTIDHSTLTGNQATGTFSNTGSGGGTQQGGGAINTQGGNISITASTLNSNSAAAAAGGGAIEALAGTVSIVNSTLSGNAAVQGGGIAVDSASVTLTADTFDFNTTPASGRGGALFLHNESGSVTLQNTILTGSGPSLNCVGVGTVTSLGHNLSDDTSCAASFTATGDLNNTDPKLGGLAANGGPTLTHALLPGSPAIDAGADGVTSTDQRGVSRPQGPHADIGSFELQPSAGPIVLTGVPISGFELSALNNVNVATFTQGNNTQPASAFSATINWGDGTSSQGVVTLGFFSTHFPTLMRYTVSGTHTYTDERSYAASVSVTDGTNSAGVATTASILEELLPDGTRGTANQRFISEVYRDMLRRKVDPAGLKGWSAMLDAGASRLQVVQAIQNAPTQEFRFVEVDELYAKYLLRAPDPIGLQNSVLFLAGGGTVEQLASFIAGSQEYFQTRALSNIDVFVSVIFADAGISFVSNRAALDDELRNGLSRATFAAQVLSVDAYRLSLVQSYYLQFLDRTLDSSGQTTWTGLLAGGVRDEIVIAGIMTDPFRNEFFNKTAP